MGLQLWTLQRFLLSTDYVRAVFTAICLVLNKVWLWIFLTFEVSFAYEFDKPWRAWSEILLPQTWSSLSGPVLSFYWDILSRVSFDWCHIKQGQVTPVIQIYLIFRLDFDLNLKNHLQRTDCVRSHLSDDLERMRDQSLWPISGSPAFSRVDQ